MGETVTISRAEDGSFWIGHSLVASGDTVTASNGNEYRVTLAADGTWTATLIADAQPTFGTATVSNQTYTSGTPITPLTLPAASGGDGTLSYSLSPSVPGLAFNASTRRLTGTPNSAGTYTMTYTVRDADGDLARLDFVLSVNGASATTGTASEYTPLEGWTVKNGRVNIAFGTITNTAYEGSCIVGGGTFNGVLYEVHSIKWQRRDTETDAWNDIPNTEQTGRVCGFGTDEPGQYRAVGEIGIDGLRTMYSSNDFFEVGGPYTPLSIWTVAPGMVELGRNSAGPGECVSSENIFSSKWQRRDNDDSEWTDIPGTERTGQVCSYTPTQPSQYRAVGLIYYYDFLERYSSSNIIIIEP